MINLTIPLNLKRDFHGSDIDTTQINHIKRAGKEKGQGKDPKELERRGDKCRGFSIKRNYDYQKFEYI